jgi:hypothetical protein
MNLSYKKKDFFFKVGGLEKQRDMGQPLMGQVQTKGGSKRIMGVNIAKSKSHDFGRSCQFG